MTDSNIKENVTNGVVDENKSLVWFKAILDLWSNDFQDWCKNGLEGCKSEEDAALILKQISDFLASIISYRKKGYGVYDEFDAEKFLVALGLDDRSTQFVKMHLEVDDFIRNVKGHGDTSDITFMMLRNVLDSFSYVQDVIAKQGSVSGKAFFHDAWNSLLSEDDSLLQKCKQCIGSSVPVESFLSKVLRTEIKCDSLDDFLRSPNYYTYLDLNWKNIGYEGAKVIAEALKKNNTLHTLDLSYNKICPEGAKEIAEVLEKNNTIHTLDLRDNDIGYKGAKYLAKALKKNNTLHTLDLKFNKICLEGAKEIAEALKKNNTLHTLDLSSNKICLEGAKYLAEALKKNNTLHTLNLYNDYIGPEGAKEIAEVLEKNNTIHTLDLRDNDIGYKGAKVIAEMLEKNNALHTLNLYNDYIGPEGAKEIAEALKKNNTIHALYLGGNNIGDLGAQVIAEALKNNHTIHALYLGGNNIGVEGAKYLAEALKKNNTIHTLYLSSNKICLEGAKVIAEALKNNHTIHALYLGGNNIGDLGAQVIAEALKNNHTIHALYLGGNNIGVEGAKVIAEALKNNHTIQEIDLSCNSIGYKGAKVIAEALENNNTLHTLYLGENKICPEGAKYLAEMLEKNNTIHTLYLKFNNIGIGSDLMKRINSLLARNKKIQEEAEKAEKAKVSLSDIWKSDASKILNDELDLKCSENDDDIINSLKSINLNDKDYLSKVLYITAKYPKTIANLISKDALIGISDHAVGMMVLYLVSRNQVDFNQLISFLEQRTSLPVSDVKDLISLYLSRNETGADDLIKLMSLRDGGVFTLDDVKSLGDKVKCSIRLSDLIKKKNAGGVSEKIFEMLSLCMVMNKEWGSEELFNISKDKLLGEGNIIMLGSELIKQGRLDINGISKLITDAGYLSEQRISDNRIGVDDITTILNKVPSLQESKVFVELIYRLMFHVNSSYSADDLLYCLYKSVVEVEHSSVLVNVFCDVFPNVVGKAYKFADGELSIGGISKLKMIVLLDEDFSNGIAKCSHETIDKLLSCYDGSGYQNVREMVLSLKFLSYIKGSGKYSGEIDTICKSLMQQHMEILEGFITDDAIGKDLYHDVFKVFEAHPNDVAMNHLNQYVEKNHPFGDDTNHNDTTDDVL